MDYKKVHGGNEEIANFQLSINNVLIQNATLQKNVLGVYGFNYLKPFTRVSRNLLYYIW